jgi:3-dehydroquinate synthetase
MVLASELAVKKEALAVKYSNQLIELLDQYGLPVRLEFDCKEVLDTLRMDKKREGDRIYFVLLSEIGKAYVEEIAIQELETLIYPP